MQHSERAPDARCTANRDGKPWTLSTRSTHCVVGCGKRRANVDFRELCRGRLFFRTRRSHKTSGAELVVCQLAGPLVRTLGGVSLFDFAGYDPEDYEARFPISNWREFVPYRHRRSWGASIWIKINREKAADALIEANELVARQHKEKAHRHKLMPFIEACYIGDIPSGLFMRTLAVAIGDTEFRSLEV